MTDKPAVQVKRYHADKISEHGEGCFMLYSDREAAIAEAVKQEREEIIAIINGQWRSTTESVGELVAKIRARGNAV